MKSYVVPYFIIRFVTPECNCNCDYCETINFSNRSHLTAEKYDHIFKECLKAHNNGVVEQFKINFAGGEPLIRFEEFADVISNYKNKYPDIFSISMMTNGTIMSYKIATWIEDNLTRLYFAIDTLRYSKPINNIDSSKLQIENLKKIRRKKDFSLFSSSVFYKQPLEEMLEMAEFATKTFDYWYFAIRRPFNQTKDQILKFSQPIIKFLYEQDFYTPDRYNFEGWDLWNKKYLFKQNNRLLELAINQNGNISTGDFNNIILGNFTSDILSLINHPDNRRCKLNIKSYVCEKCLLKDECSGGYPAYHTNQNMLKERCDAIQELFKYVGTLKK